MIGEFWIYKQYSEQPCFILRDPSIALLRKLKYERGLFIIPKQKEENNV